MFDSEDWPKVRTGPEPQETNEKGLGASIAMAASGIILMLLGLGCLALAVGAVPNIRLEYPENYFPIGFCCMVIGVFLLLIAVGREMK